MPMNSADAISLNTLYQESGLPISNTLELVMVQMDTI